MHIDKPRPDRLEQIARALLAVALAIAVSWVWVGGSAPDGLLAGLVG